MNEESIGQAAGKVWKTLQNHAPQALTLESLEKLGGLRAEEALTGIGWLAREGKLEFQREQNKILIGLAQSEVEA